MNTRKAFTLIELLVVVAIIALLIALLLPSLGRAREQAKLVKCATNMKAIYTAIASYAAQNSDTVVEGGAFYRNDVAAVPPAAPGKGCALLCFPEALWLDGDVTTYQNPYTTGSGHFPIMQQKKSVFYCPNADKSVQYGQSGAGYDGYGLNYYNRSRMMDTYSTDGSGNCGTIDGALPNGNEWVVIKKLGRLRPTKILGYEGYYTAGAGGNGNGQYWVYNRHLAATTTQATTVTKYRGVSNYMFCDGHVESNGVYYTQYPSAVRTAGMAQETAESLSPWGGDPPYPY